MVYILFIRKNKFITSNKMLTLFQKQHSPAILIKYFPHLYLLHLIFISTDRSFYCVFRNRICCTHWQKPRNVKNCLTHQNDCLCVFVNYIFFVNHTNSLYHFIKITVLKADLATSFFNNIKWNGFPQQNAVCRDHELLLLITWFSLAVYLFQLILISLIKLHCSWLNVEIFQAENQGHDWYVCNCCTGSMRCWKYTIEIIESSKYNYITLIT